MVAAAGWFQVLGGVRAEQQSFEAAIAAETVLLYAPEGWRGLAKAGISVISLQALIQALFGLVCAIGFQFCL